jgi:hypothetical protein
MHESMALAQMSLSRLVVEFFQNQIQKNRSLRGALGHTSLHTLVEDDGKHHVR